MGRMRFPIQRRLLHYHRGARSENLPRGINDAGQIVGYFWDSLGSHGFLYDAGAFSTIDVPKPRTFLLFTPGDDIDNAGQIVGLYVATVPEPGSILLLGSGLAVFCAAACLRKAAAS